MLCVRVRNLKAGRFVRSQGLDTRISDTIDKFDGSNAHYALVVLAGVTGGVIAAASCDARDDTVEVAVAVSLGVTLGVACGTFVFPAIVPLIMLSRKAVLAYRE